MRLCLVIFAFVFFVLNPFLAHAAEVAAPGPGPASDEGQAGEKKEAAAPEEQPGEKKAPAVQVAGASDATFKKEVLESSAPVVVLFWSPQCGPCDEVAQGLAATLEGNARVVRVNTKMAYRAQAAYRITEVPAFLLFVGGKESARATGIMSREQLLKKLGFN